MSERIAAVVVTYNRKALLLGCIDSLLKQTRKLDRIFIVNNASTDGTYEYLVENQINKHENIEIINMEENTGGAGGFHFGMKLAYDQKFDWIWVMDDDIVANDVCLEEMLRLQNISQCIHPRKVWADGTDYIWGATYNLNRLKSKNISIPINEDPLAAQMDTVSFEGMLINRTIVTNIGFPDKDFFIAGDDIEYGLRVSKETQIVSTYNAIFIRKVTPSMKSTLLRNSMRIGPWREYYYLRNLFLIKKHHNVGIVQDFWILARLLKKIIGVFIYNDEDKMTKIHYFLLAFKHGMQGKFGHTL